MDPILAWNNVALEANRVSHTDDNKREQNGPTLSSRALAIVHLAMYDAFVGASGKATKLTPYLTGLPAASPKASVNAAVAAAAHATLSELYPSQKPFFNLVRNALTGIKSPGLNEGLEFGEDVAREILKDREGDPGADAVGHITPTAPGKHRPDPDKFDQGFHAPFYGERSKLFAVTERYELDKPPELDREGYKSALRQVRRIGIAPELMGTLPPNSPRRTVDQTVIGVYWGYDGARNLGTPPRLYNQIVRKVARNKKNTPEDNARLFALVNTAMADAGILAWDQKYIHNFWRPVVGIREHDKSMGPEGVGNNDIDDESQPDWLPLGAPSTNTIGKNLTPPFPAYPSGHATFGAAAFHIARLFYGLARGHRDRDNLFKDQDGKELTFVSDELNSVNQDNKGAVRPRHVRTFPGGLWDMIIENGRSRVFLGVHWVFDAFAVKDNGDPGEPDLDQNVGGVPLGLTIAEDIFCKGANKETVNKSKVGPRKR